MKLNVNADEVLKRRYLLRNINGRIIETPEQMFRRAAKAVAAADKRYNRYPKDAEEEFLKVMTELEFLPNSPALMNAGTKLSQLSACFVIPVEDNIESIFDGVKDMAMIHKTGGGTGFNFSHLRPKGDIVMSTKGQASGPVSFMRIYDTAADVVKQGGRRRGANMAILNVNHPDIAEFIISKRYDIFKNFNLSVAVTDKFIEEVKKNGIWKLVNPRNGKVVMKVKARELFDLIIENAYMTGDPGLIFIDEINKRHPLKKLGMVEATNPCGEVPMLPYESCNLGSINLSKFVEAGQIDWSKLREVVRIGVHFLDNVIDINRYPLPEIEKVTLSNRKIGLGVMGFADMLIKLGIPYDSDEAVNTAEQVMRFITKEARQKSIELGAERGSFPNFNKSEFYRKYKTLRNATCTTVAPTGTISIIAGCSSGIEPLFAISFLRIVMEGTRMLEVNDMFEKIAKQKGFYDFGLMDKIAQEGTIQRIREIPIDVKHLFVTAHDIKPESHVKIQAAFQKYTDNAVSKTVNLRHTANEDDIKEVFLLAHKLRCKGITVYRDGSKKEQVLNIIKDKVHAGSEYSGGCQGTTCNY